MLLRFGGLHALGAWHDHATDPAHVAGPVKGHIPFGDGTILRPLSIDPTSGRQHLLLDFVLDALPPQDDLPLRGDNPFDRLPIDFTTELCEDLTRLTNDTTDPIFGALPLGLLPGGAGDFRAKRSSVIKRLTVPRVIPGTAATGPRRLIVRVVQEWKFIGYSLGELTDTQALDPGVVLQEITQTAQSLDRTNENGARRSAVRLHTARGDGCRSRSRCRRRLPGRTTRLPRSSGAYQTSSMTMVSTRTMRTP